ncbi:D-erythro-7,8-dihydroneopterin triphosphate epimerase, partial [Pseudomonas sp. FG-3G]
ATTSTRHGAHQGQGLALAHVHWHQRGRNPQQTGCVDQPDHPLRGPGCGARQRHRPRSELPHHHQGDHRPRGRQPFRPARTPDPGTARSGHGQRIGAVCRSRSRQAPRLAICRVGIDYARRQPGYFV